MKAPPTLKNSEGNAEKAEVLSRLRLRILPEGQGQCKDRTHAFARPWPSQVAALALAVGCVLGSIPERWAGVPPRSSSVAAQSLYTLIPPASA